MPGGTTSAVRDASNSLPGGKTPRASAFMAVLSVSRMRAGKKGGVRLAAAAYRVKAVRFPNEAVVHRITSTIF